jgi:hypothetical protein
VKAEFYRAPKPAETKGEIMSDWIDKLAEKDKAQAESRRTQEEFRLHCAKVINAKAPEWWSAVIERLQTDCSKLKNTFPNDRGRQCDIIKNGLDWDLQGCKLPWIILSMRLNADGQSVDISESIKNARDSVVPDRRDEIKIGVMSNESLEFTYKGRAYTTPESLAQALIMHVCRNME